MAASEIAKHAPYRAMSTECDDASTSQKRKTVSPYQSATNLTIDD